MKLTGSSGTPIFMMSLPGRRFAMSVSSGGASTSSAVNNEGSWRNRQPMAQIATGASRPTNQRRFTGGFVEESKPPPYRTPNIEYSESHQVIN